MRRLTSKDGDGHLDLRSFTVDGLNRCNVYVRVCFVNVKCLSHQCFLLSKCGPIEFIINIPDLDLLITVAPKGQTKYKIHNTNCDFLYSPCDFCIGVANLAIGSTL